MAPPTTAWTAPPTSPRPQAQSFLQPYGWWGADPFLFVLLQNLEDWFDVSPLVMRQDADCGSTNHLVACRWLGLKENNLWTNDFNAKRMLGLDAEHWWRKIRSFSFLWLIIAWVFMIRVTHEKVPLWFQLKAAQWHRYFVAHLGFQLLFISLHGHRIEYFVGFLCYKLYKKTSVFL